MPQRVGRSYGILRALQLALRPPVSAVLPKENDDAAIWVYHSAAMKTVLLRRLLRGLVPTAVVLAASTSFGQAPPSGPVFQGKAHIVDGDTLEIGSDRIELHGIDAPEPEQLCERAGVAWRCGMEATYAMAALLETHWVTCHRQAGDFGDTVQAVCRLGGPNGVSVNREIVRQGWALAVRPDGQDYVDAERHARQARVGLWSGTFVAPWEWRRAHENGTAAN